LVSVKKKTIILIILIFILVLSFLLNILFIDQEGFGNHYYAGAVKSMLKSFNNFFFASSDANGFVTVDKPPAGLWVQAVFALIFGFSGFSMMLPSAIAGTISVFLVYRIVKKAFGYAAALAAALILAVTPIFVALSRNNTMDAILICVLLCASYQFLKGLEKNRFRNIIFSFIILGIGFNIKMAQAFVILPVMIICYFVFFKERPLKKTADGFLAVLVLGAVSLSWAFAVEITPPENRPYIGGTACDSVFELAVGYNGISRAMSFIYSEDRFQSRDFHFETGEPGFFRLFNNKLGGQASWLIPLALFGTAAYLLLGFLIKPLSKGRRHQLLFWGLWFVFLYLYLNLNTGLFHTHYTALIAPAVAALSGIGITGLYKCYKTDKFIRWLLPAAVISTVLLEVFLSSYFPEWNSFLTILMVIISSVTLIFLVINIFLKIETNIRIVNTAFAVCFLSLLIIPAAWSLTPIMYGGDPGIPYARPDLKDFKESYSEYLHVEDRYLEESYKLIEFLEKNRGDEEYLVGIDSSLSGGATLIMMTDGDIMCLGGFSGADPVISPEELKELINSGKIRYFITGPMSFANECARWIKSYGEIILYEYWKNPGELEGYSLYDCRPSED
jgi:4-amino-4-deoxy-L-arabinose transferase-like glycosyltransferase